MADLGDTDVKEERLRTLHGPGRHDLLRINNLSKVYKTRKLGRIRAVDKLTLAIPAGEVRTLSNKLHSYIFTFSKQAFNESLEFCNRP